MRQQPSRSKPFSIYHEAAQRTPFSGGRLADPVVLAPGRKGLIEDVREFLDTVTGPRRPVGHQREPATLQHPQASPLGCGHKLIEANGLAGCGGGGSSRPVGRRAGHAEAKGQCHNESGSTCLRHASQFTQTPRSGQVPGSAATGFGGSTWTIRQGVSAASAARCRPLERRLA